MVPTIYYINNTLLKIKAIFLEEFQVHSKTKGYVQRFLIYFLAPHMHNVLFVPKKPKQNSD